MLQLLTLLEPQERGAASGERAMRALLGFAATLLGACSALSSSSSSISARGIAFDPALVKVELSYPTGLHFSSFTDRNSKRSTFCILQHNSVALAPKHKNVYKVENIISDSMCDDIVAKTEEWASRNGGWSVDRHLDYPTTDLPLQAVFGSLSALHGTVASDFLPEIAQAFGLNEELLKVGEIFIAKYEAMPGKQNKLAAHVDGTPFSFVLALNDPSTFTGGGTRFLESGLTYRAEKKGTVFLFSGKNRHEGVATTEGTRYIMTGFCNYLRYSDSGSFEFDYNRLYDGSAGEQLLIGDVVRGVQVGEAFVAFSEGQSEQQVQQQLLLSRGSGAVSVFVERHEDNRYLLDRGKITSRKLAKGEYWSLDDFIG